MIGCELREILRNLALAIGIVKRIVDQLRLDAEACGRVAIDADGKLRRICQEIARNVGKLRQRFQLFEDAWTPKGQLVDARVLQRVLKLGARYAAAHGDVLPRLQEQRDALHLRELRPQPVDRLRGGRLALLSRFQRYEEAAGIGGLRAAGADYGSEGGNVWIVRKQCAERLLQTLHFGRRDVLCRFRQAEDKAVVLHRKKALRNLDEQYDSKCHRDEEHGERYRLMT